MIRLLVVDDHELVRVGLRHILADYPSIQIAAEATDGEGALRMNRRFRPDVVLLDVCLPGLSGFETTRRLNSTVQINGRDEGLKCSGFDAQRRRSALAHPLAQHEQLGQTNLISKPRPNWSKPSKPSPGAAGTSARTWRSGWPWMCCQAARPHRSMAFLRVKWKFC